MKAKLTALRLGIEQYLLVLGRLQHTQRSVIFISFDVLLSEVWSQM